jgi:glycosyltransferase involved in cell wall biosynthesis
MTLASIKIRRTHAIRWVHATTWRVSLIQAVMFSRASLFLTVHGREVLNVPTALARVLRSALRRSDLTTFVSEATKEAAVLAIPSAADGHWVVRYNGVSYRDRADRYVRQGAAKRLNLLSLCRLVPRKNVQNSILAVARLCQGGRDDIFLKVAGVGGQRAELERLVHDLNLQDRVEFLGYVDEIEVPALYDWADIFMHPHSHVGEGEDFEGFGLVVADAMSFGCAAIVGSSGGPAELVQDGKDGFLVDGGSVDEVTRVLEALYDDRTRLFDIGTAAKAAALSRFSWGEHIQPALERIQAS